MRILVTGASGLIGKALCALLTGEGHEVVRVLHHPDTGIHTETRAISLDMARALRPKDWTPYLAGVDAVVNCAGVLQDSARENTRHVHMTGASALFIACEQAGVNKVIHFSAIGVDCQQPSAFSASKLAGDEALMARRLEWVILRPSVVLGRPAFGASALFRGLAALPLLPLMPDTGPLQVVQLDDVISTVLFFLKPGSPSRLTLELAGPVALSMSEVVGCYRRWLGWNRAREFILPNWTAAILYRLGDAAAQLGWRPPMRTNAAKEITRGAVGDPRPWMTATGIQPSSLPAALRLNPATVQERWFAGLYFVKPALFVVLPLFWILTGIISLTVGWRSGVDLLIGTAAGALAEPAVVAGALADIVVGTLIAWRPTSRLGLFGAITVSLFYAVAGSILRPDLWYEPLGPLLKIFPTLVLHFAALAILEER
ncbi:MULTISPECIES: SDR family oxidoreductase [unclassified Mesorhizobium]|uniref:SDR family oxidoreductase n=1 Tax=unclassified Mesorhizobium TaxID=325217 RepID=UPI001CCDF6C2|nr:MULTISPECIES: SDR family oxidoreductase [unclassified Mesorhizobium]MBZ9742588.1 SDR family oxidoreductase [Mesorhizobium sp. CO1-1-4]MBZ9801303.1 SDR family oxidoreductase [Mesorhizobium sp. ES1-6]